MSMINVLHVTFDMAIGGTEQVIRQLVGGMDATRFNSSLLCIDGRVGEIGEIVQEQGIKVHQLKRKPGFDRALIAAVRALIKDDHIDIVHCHQYTPYIYGWFGALGTSARVVFTEHGRFYPDRYSYKRWLINPIISLLTAEVTAISAATKEALARYELFPLGKIKVIYNGIQPRKLNIDRIALLDALGLKESDRVVGTVSRLDSIKNQLMMIDAFSQSLSHCKHLKLLIVGDGPMRKELERRAASLGLIDKVIFTGFQKEPLSYMSLMEVFLLSSFSEGTSMTLLEAMSLAIPCVVTNVGGNPEIVVDKETGFVVPSDDTKLFSRSINMMIENKKEKQKKGEAGLVRFKERFSVAKMVQQYTNLYLKHVKR